ncbi:MAG: hypothetical protein IKA62_06370 [Clostridia bacterium]|nr:hypothetical protein [Clostridia bacterium]
MREILFRGKSKVQGSRWLYGDVLIYENSAQIWETIDNRKYNSVVSLETVGQYTGLTDKNGKRIFEGDIVKMLYKDDIAEIGPIMWSDVGLRYKFASSDGASYSFDCTATLEVIGNIHDNPELLKGKYMAEIKKLELTSEDVISDTTKSLVDFIAEAKKTAIKENIIANTVIINETFAKTNDIGIVFGRSILHIPPMICGLEVHISDELPDGYDFAVVRAPETERERIIKQANKKLAEEIFEEIEKVIGDKYNHYVFGNNYLDSIEQDAIINFSDELSDCFEEIKKKYTEEKEND